MRLNLGCGRYPTPGWINLDSVAWPGVDIVRDVLRGLPFSDGVIEEIYSENFLEHIPQSETIWIMNEMYRVISPAGIARHLIPQAGTAADFGDPTHLSRWSRDTLTYFEWSHGRNAYYGDLIKPWVIEIEETQPNKLLEVKMRPYHA